MTYRYFIYLLVVVLSHLVEWWTGVFVDGRVMVGMWSLPIATGKEWESLVEDCLESTFVA